MALRAGAARSPMIELLAARASQAAGESDRSFEILRDARTRYPHSRPLAYAWLDALQAAGRSSEALGSVGEQLRAWPRDPHLYEFQRKPIRRSAGACSSISAGGVLRPAGEPACGDQQLQTRADRGRRELL